MQCLLLSSVEPKKVNLVKNLIIAFAFSYVQENVLLFASFFSILNRVLSEMSNTRITVFRFTRSENIHILCNFCIFSSVEPTKVNYVKNLKIVSAFSYAKQKVLLFAFNLLCYIESWIIKNIKYTNNCF